MKIFVEKSINFDSLYDLLSWYFDNDCPKTYYEDGSLQCDAHKNRSIDALIDLSRTYFPEVSNVEVIKTLQKLHKENINNIIYSGAIICKYCPTIKRPVFMHYTGNYFFPYRDTMIHGNIDKNNEINYTNSKYTMLDLARIILEDDILN